MSHTPFCRVAVHKSVLRWLAFVLLFGALFAKAQAQSSPVANARIENQASASYRDNLGQLATVQSNTVVTVVLQVGSYSLTPSQSSPMTRLGDRGSTVYFPYSLRNTGNGPDVFNINVAELSTGSNFDRIAVYLDDGTGLPASTTALCSVTTAGNNCSVDRSLGAGDAFNFVVAYTLPGNADATWNQNTATVTVKPKDSTTSWFSSYTQTNADKSEARTDTVRFSAAAIFQVQKALTLPAFNQPDGTAWPNNPSGPRPSSGLGAETTFTITFRNTGGGAGTLYLRDAIPSGLTYKGGSAVLSCAPGTALTDGTGGDNSLCGGGIEYEFDGTAKVIHLRIPSLAAGSVGTLSFIVQPNSTAGTASKDTVNVAQFNPGDSSGSCASLLACKTTPGDLDTTPEGSGTYVVTAMRRVQLGAQDTSPGTPLSTGDVVTSARLIPGLPGRQTHTLTNRGDTADVFNLSVTSSGANAFPAGTSFVWKYVGSGGQPASNLSDTNGDGTVDTGPVAAGASLSLILEITLPAGTSVGNGRNYEATALARSINYNTANNAQDATFARATDVVGGLVDLIGKNFAATPSDVGVGPGPGQTPDATTPTVVAGSAVHQITLNIVNNQSISNSYSLSHSANGGFTVGLPAGWAVRFSSTACSSVTEITSTGTVTAGANTQIYACVYSPVTSPTVNQPVYFRVMGTATPAADESRPIDTIYYAVSVVASNAYSFSLSSRGDMTIQGGGSAVFTYALTNNGTNTCGLSPNRLRLTVNLPATSTSAGWTAATYIDNPSSGSPGVLDANDTLLPADGTLAQNLTASSGLIFFVRVNAPAGVTIGSQVGLSLQVADVNSSGDVQQPPSGCGSQGFESRVTVSSGVVTLVTQQSVTDAACAAPFPTTWSNTTRSVKPGGCIYYQVVATNTSASPVTDVNISTNAPLYTTVSATPTPTCDAVNLTGTSVARGGSGTQVTCGSASNTLNPSGTVTLRYAVTVNP